VQITDVRLRKVSTEGRMKAIASITIDGEFVVHDIRVIDGNNGMFVAMPSKKTPDGEFRDIAHPINMEMREILQKAIIDKYEATLLEEGNQVYNQVNNQVNNQELKDDNDFNQPGDDIGEQEEV
jgi:stage V sporulation protein G